ncbi:MAG TPA: hypothetical protein VEG37_01105 [Burkholderiales bacterium]|nr:hypothetical protein [Burkholderiales bacterium]
MRPEGRLLEKMALLFCGLIMCACTTVKGPQPTTAPQPFEKPNSVDGYLAYYHHVTNISGDELKKEYLAINQAYVQTKNNDSRLQLALLLSLPNTSFKDNSKALALIREFLANKTSDTSQVKDFALLLSTYVSENKRQEEKMKAEQSRNEEQVQKLDELKDKLKAEQSRSEELEQKLEALKGIEKSIIERQQSQPVITR